MPRRRKEEAMPLDERPAQEEDETLSPVDDDEDEEEEEEEEAPASERRPPARAAEAPRVNGPPPSALPEPDPTLLQALADRKAEDKLRKRADKASKRKPADPTNWGDEDAELLWPELLAMLHRNGQHPSLLYCRVRRMEPPPALSVGAAFDATAVVGSPSEPPGDALKRYVQDYYHLPYPAADYPCKYRVTWYYKGSNEFFRHATIRCLSKQEIEIERRARLAQLQGHQPAFGQGGAPGMTFSPPPPPQGAPWGPAYAPPQGYPPGPGAFGAPPPPAGTEAEAELRRQLRDKDRDMEFMRGQIDEVRRAQAEGRAPRLDETPPSAQSSEERIAGATARAVIQTLMAAGVIQNPHAHGAASPAPAPAPPGQPAGAAPASAQGAPAASPPQNPLFNTAMKLTEEVMGAVGAATMQMMKKSVAQVVTNMNGAGAPAEPEGPPEVVTVDPKEKLPYEAIELEGRTLFGKPAVYPRNKETGGIDLRGFVMENTGIVEKGAELVGTLVEGASAWLKRKGIMNEDGSFTAEPVTNIPPGAQDANPGGFPGV